ncbi:hypothetical protein MMC25_000754 [Agyrium rufum]|nr:hypothetical protein [Agyrium rufum]
MPQLLPADSPPPDGPSVTQPSPPLTVDRLPPEAIALATRMFESARRGDLQIFEQAIPAGLPPNLTNEKGNTLLMLAAYHGHIQLVSFLLSHNADPNVLNERQQSPLAGAIFKGEDEVVELLLQGGADPGIGNPSARDAVRLFRQEEKWGARFGMPSEEVNGTSGHSNGDSNGHGA